MPLVALKCPNCNGEVQFEENMMSGFCIHCGSKIIRERSVKGTISIDRTTDIVNHLKLAKETLRIHDWENASKLVNNILLMDADCLDAWYMKALLCFRDKSMYESLLNEIENKSLECYGIFSKEDIKKCWGEHNLYFIWNPGRYIYAHVKASVTVDEKETFSVGRETKGICGISAGKHNLSVCVVVVWEGEETVGSDIRPVSLSFDVSKDHHFMITTERVGFWEPRTELRITQMN